MRLFEQFSDVDLDDVAIACGSAHGEGAFDPTCAVAEALRREYEARGRLVPPAYGGYGHEPKEWLIEEARL